MIHAVESEEKLEMLNRHLQLDLSLNDLRITIGCFRAVAYLMKIDDEPYIDSDAFELLGRLEKKYSRILSKAENRRAS